MATTVEVTNVPSTEVTVEDGTSITVDISDNAKIDVFLDTVGGATYLQIKSEGTLITGVPKALNFVGATVTNNAQNEVSIEFGNFVGIIANNPSSQSIPNEISTPLNFPNTLKNNGVEILGGQESKIYFRKTGVWNIQFNFSIATTSDGVVIFGRLRKNGANIDSFVSHEITSSGAPLTGFATMRFSAIIELNKDDYLEALAFQSSGAALSTAVAATLRSSSFSATYLGT